MHWYEMNACLEFCLINKLSVVDCGELMAPENGTVSTSPDTTFTSTATYSCNDGYTLEGVTTRTCLASGSWSDCVPTCTGIYFSEDSCKIFVFSIQRCCKLFVFTIQR